MSDESEMMELEAEARLAEGGSLATITVPDLHTVKTQFLKSIAKPSDRDQQVKIGPSSVGGCPYCLGYDMAAKLCPMPNREAEKFGYAAWIGTGVHYWLEHNLDLAHGAGYPIETFRETKLKDIFEIPGYGSIGGSCDLMVPDWGRTFDFKFPGKFSYEKVQMALAKGRMAASRGEEVKAEHMPSMQYRVQQQIYRKGWEQLGYRIDKCVIAFLPRHTNDINDAIIWEEDANDALYEGAVARAVSIWEYTEAGQLDEIPSDADCFTCSPRGPGRGDLTNYNQAIN